jgi:hypothetical protein
MMCLGMMLRKFLNVRLRMYLGVMLRGYLNVRLRMHLLRDCLGAVPTTDVAPASVKQHQ